MGKKTLEEMLNDNTAKPGTKDATRRLATFIGYWDEMESAYKKGWTWLHIHNALFQEGIIDYSYSTFLHYKDRTLRRKLEAAKLNAGTRSAGDAKGALIERPAGKPGSTKVELPVFGEVSRDTKRF
jgi:hypothetical protein